jgi:tartrate-resistant acid phosphatase type 5
MEPFVHLVDVTHTRALVAWGAFWFERGRRGDVWGIVDDERLPEVAGGRHGCIGAGAEPYGDAVVQALDRDGRVVAEARTAERSWVWLDGLAPDTEYGYRIVVDGREWAAGERWDWVPSDRGGYDLERAGRHYDLRFRTAPAPDDPAPLTFVALGDFGVGICVDAESSRRQRRIAEVLEHLVQQRGVRLVLGLGDSVYLGEQGRVDDESGGEDDDWYSSYFQPYRYVISRVPVYPAVGNHDASDTEGSDDRAQMEDNFHTAERFGRADGRSSVGPGLFYRFSYGADVELVCVDSSLADPTEAAHRFFQDPAHLRWLEETFAAPGPRWRIPFSHHPAYCAGPEHGNDEEIIETLLPLYGRGGVRLVLAGHEHNFQITRADGLTHVVSGAGGKLREALPQWFDAARTDVWAMQAHALLVEIDGDTALLTPVSGMRADGRGHLMTALSPRNEVRYPPFRV